VLPSEHVDWEAELVVVIGRPAHAVAEKDAWSHVAGLTIGQDYSERALQVAGDFPQYSLAKSFPGFAPIGPFLVTPDEFADPDDLSIECEINGESVQSGRTSAMIFGIPTLIARLSTVCTLHPGDLIFTGTPSGVGFARTPARYLSPGDVVTTRIEHLGEMRQACLGAGDN
jgi:2-keto-4-pentenoate hydratase/2-oxohepta-3-ene-1,7-dioic acid hydratase in catechol pathway